MDGNINQVLQEVRSTVDLYFPQEKSDFISTAIQALRPRQAELGLQWKIRSRGFSTRLGRAFQIKAPSNVEIGPSAMALTELLSNGQSSKNRGAALWLLNNSGPGEALQEYNSHKELRTIQMDVLKSRYTDAQKIQHELSGCWMPVWVASQWLDADAFPEMAELLASQGPLQGAESISPRMQGVKLTSTASNVFEMTRNMAVLEGPQTAIAAGIVDQPGSSRVIPAIRQGTTTSAHLPEQSKMPLAVIEVNLLNIPTAEERRPDVVVSDIKAPISQQSVEPAPSAALRLPPVRLQQLRKADSGSPSSSARTGMDLPPGTPLSDTGRSEGRAGAYMDVRMAFTGVQTNPLQTMRELPSEAAAAIIKSMRLPVQLYLESFLGELWNEAVTDRRSAVGLLRTIKQQFRHFREAIWTRKQHAEEMIVCVDESIQFLNKLNRAQGPPMQQINAGIETLMNFLEGFPPPRGVGPKFLEAERCLEVGRKEMADVFERSVKCQQALLKIGSYPLSAAASKFRSERTSVAGTPRTDPPSGTPTARAEPGSLFARDSDTSVPPQQQSATSNQVVSAAKEVLEVQLQTPSKLPESISPSPILSQAGKLSPEAAPQAIQVSVNAQGGFTAEVATTPRRNPSPPDFTQQPHQPSIPPSMGVADMLMASTILLNRLRRADTVPKASVARGYQQAKAVALALKECAVASPGMDDTERASNLYHAVIAFLSFHFDDISAAPFSDATVKDVRTLVNDRDNISEMLNSLDC